MFIQPPAEPEDGIPSGLQASYALAAALISKGFSEGEVLKKLLESGLSDSDANRILTALAQNVGRSEDVTSTNPNLTVEEFERNVRRESGQRNMAIGGMICFIGVAVTLGTFFLPSGEVLRTP